MNLEQINALEKAYEKKVEDQFYRGIRAIQQDQCDVFGFGEMIHRHDPKAWQAVKTNWNEKGFARLKVNVHAHVVISHSQLRNNSFRSNIK
jgi:spore germination protein KC